MNGHVKIYSKSLFMGFLIFNLFLVLAVALPPFVKAQGPILQVNDDTSQPQREGGKLYNPIGSETLADFVQKITSVALKIGVPIAGLFIIWAGFKFVTSRGDETAIKDAKKIFWYTIIGTAILLAANTIARVLSDTIIQVAG